MSKWIAIIAGIIIILVLSIITVKYLCNVIETNIAYTNPMIKFVRKSAKTTTITIHSDTKVNIAKSDRIQLLPDGSYTFFNPTDIVLSNSTSVTNHSAEETTENGSSKPLLQPTKNAPEWVLTLNYTHINGEHDIQSLTCYKHVLWGFYAGVGIYVRMDMFGEDYVPKYHWQNITVGIAYIF